MLLETYENQDEVLRNFEMVYINSADHSSCGQYSPRILQVNDNVEIFYVTGVAYVHQNRARYRPQYVPNQAVI